MPILSENEIIFAFFFAFTWYEHTCTAGAYTAVVLPDGKDYPGIHPASYQPLSQLSTTSVSGGF